jgi:hypothetical protein
MAERIHISPEVNSERHDETNHEKAEVNRGLAEVESTKEQAAKLEHLRGQIEHEAKNKTETAKVETDQSEKHPANRPPASKDLRKISLGKELVHIRNKLKPADRAGSKLIHNPLVKNISEVSAKTITRPSGLLGGGIFAFLGSGLYYYLTKHVGLKYNYLLFLLLFVGGFILGLIIELGVSSLSKKQSK